MYCPWFGKSVVLLESIADICIRIKYGWEMDVRKKLILAVEEYVVALDSLTMLQGMGIWHPRIATTRSPSGREGLKIDSKKTRTFCIADGVRNLFKSAHFIRIAPEGLMRCLRMVEFSANG